MNHRLLNTLLVCLLAPLATVVFAQDSTGPAEKEIVISTGVEGGGYWNAGNRLQTQASSMGLAVQNRASVGSINNLRDLLDPTSPVSLAFTQADALQYYLKSRADAAQRIETLADIGDECVFLISDEDGDIETLDDMMAAKRMHLGIKSASSGINVTWRYMASLLPELKDVTITYGNAVEMLTDFIHPLSDIERAVMVVQAPNERSPEIDMVVANPDRYRFVDIDNDALTRPGPGGATIYRAMKVKPGAVEHASAVDTICVHGLLVANKNKLGAAQRSTLADLIANHWSQVASGTK